MTKLSIVVAARHGVIDVPNQRSSHSQPVPRCGGVPFVVIYLAALAVASILGLDWGGPGVAPALLAGGALVAGVGFLDDLIQVKPIARLVAHLAAATITLLMLPELPVLPVFGFEIEPYSPLLLCMLLGIVWSINLFNFMDGVDGIAGAQAITMFLCSLVILAVQDNGDWVQPLLFLTSCVAGFLVWNWPPAKIFMGDSASGFLGFCLAGIAVATSADGSLNLWVWLILGGVFLVDATTTLVVRIVRGEAWSEAHRSHAYQILSRRFESHAKVTLAVLGINLFWLFPFAFFAARNPSVGILLWLVAWTPLVMLAIGVGAGKAGVAEPAMSSDD